MVKIVIGGVYYVKDDEIELAKVDGGNRIIHAERRPFLVLTAPRFNSDPDWNCVLGCPISSSTQKKTELCVKVPANEGGLSKKGWVRIPALQLLEKTDLEDFLGVLPQRRLEIVQARILQYMGIIDEGSDDDEDD